MNVVFNAESETNGMTQVDSWPKIRDSDHISLGQVSGVATDSKGNIHIFHRGPRVWDSRLVNTGDM